MIFFRISTIGSALAAMQGMLEEQQASSNKKNSSLWIFPVLRKRQTEVYSGIIPVLYNVYVHWQSYILFPPQCQQAMLMHRSY